MLAHQMMEIIKRTLWVRTSGKCESHSKVQLPLSMRYTSHSDRLNQSLKLLTITQLHKKQTKNQSDLA